MLFRVSGSSFQPPATSFFNLLSHSLHHPPLSLSSSSLRNIFVSHQIFSLTFPSNFSAVFRPDFYDVPDNFVIPDRYYLFSYDKDENVQKRSSLCVPPPPNFEQFSEAKTAIPGEGVAGRRFITFSSRTHFILVKYFSFGDETI